jgi:hypothetical protein
VGGRGSAALENKVRGLRPTGMWGTPIVSGTRLVRSAARERIRRVVDGCAGGLDAFSPVTHHPSPLSAALTSACARAIAGRVQTIPQI